MRWMRLERLYSHPHQALRASFSHRVKPFTRRKTQFMTVRSIHARLRAIHDRKVNSPFNPPVDFFDRLRLGLTTFGLRLQTAHCAVCFTPTHPLHKGALHATGGSNSCAVTRNSLLTDELTSKLVVKRLRREFSLRSVI